MPNGFLCPQPGFLRRSEHIFPRKNIRVYRNKHNNLRTSRNKSSRSTLLEFAALGNGSEIKHGRASAFRYFLSTTMVFAADRTNFPKKNTRVYVKPGAINKQLVKCKNYS